MDTLQNKIRAAHRSHERLLMKAVRKNTSLSDEAIENLPEILAALERVYAAEDRLKEYIESLNDPQPVSRSHSHSHSGGRKTKRRCRSN